MLKSGFKLIDNFVGAEFITPIIREFENYSISEKVGCLRHAEKKLNSVQTFVQSSLLLESAQYYLSGTPKVVRTILFCKSVKHNWSVCWHQDKTVAVSEKFESEGWKYWTVKDKTQHVQPPLHVLNQMVTFRIHLDDIHQDNGCLRVIPGSHKMGLLPQKDILVYANQSASISCNGSRGSALVMRPHILHSSSKVLENSIRRVLHVELSDYELPTGVTWA